MSFNIGELLINKLMEIRSGYSKKVPAEACNEQIYQIND